MAVTFLNNHATCEGIFRKAGSISRQKTLRVHTSILNYMYTVCIHVQKNNSIIRTLFIVLSTSQGTCTVPLKRGHFFIQSIYM